MTLRRRATIRRWRTFAGLLSLAGVATCDESTALIPQPTKLGFVAQPSVVTAGSAMNPAFQVAVQDADGNTFAAATTFITVAISTGSGATGAVLGGTLTLPAVNGVATFGDLAIEKAGNGFTLMASAASLTSGTSSAFDVSAAAPAKLSVTTQPSGVTAGAVIAPVVQIGIQDAFGNAVTGATTNITIAITSGSGAPVANLGGTLTQAAVSGMASFDNLTIDKAAAGYTLTATAPSLTATTTSAFTVSPGPAARLEITSQPSNATAAAAISPAVQVAVQDAFGNAVTTSTASLTIAITNGTGVGGAALSGTATQAAVNGVATFGDLMIDKAGSGYTLTATATALASATSGAFTVSPGAAVKLTFAVQPTTVTSATAMSPAVQVVVSDAQDNTVTSATASVTLAITNGTGTSGATLGGTVTQAASNGVATFSTLTVEKSGANYTLTATATNLTSAASIAFSVNAGPASKLAFTTQPGAVAQGAAISPAVQITVQDAAGNTVTSSSASTAVAITGGTGTGGAALGGTRTVAAASGIATFSDLTIDKAGSGYTLTATGSGLAPAVSTQFTINGGTIGGTITLVATLLSASSTVPDALVVSSKGPPLDAPPIHAAAKAFVADELIVTFRPAAGLRLPSIRAMTVASLREMNVSLRDQAQQLALANDAQVIGASPAIRAVRMRVPDPSRIESIKALLERDPSVETVERNALVFASEGRRRVPSPQSMASQLTPNDPDYVRQSWHYSAIDLDYGWSITTGSNSVIVAVVDDGIRFDHPDIAANLTSDGYDFVNNDVEPLCGGGTANLAGDGDGPDSDPTKPNDYVFNSLSSCFTQNTGVGAHGLHVAGTIGAAGNNGQGGTGINWSVRIRAVRVLNSGGRGTNYDVAQGILYAAGLPADNGTGTPVQASTPARIINLSLGGPSNSTDLQNAVASAVANGTLVIASAGNLASSAPSYPAAYPEVISVSSIGPDLNLATYSNFGSTIDIAAPGGDIADGDASYGVYSIRWNFGSNSPTYQFIQGTSMAAPHVSGVAALILAQNPSLSASDVRARLESFAVDLGPAGRDDSYGVGLLNARNSLTQTTSLSGATRAFLFNALTGAVVADVTVAVNGSYSFTQVVAGAYWLFAGQDEDADGQFGLPRRRWSAFGGTATPTIVSVAGAATQSVSFNLGFAFERETTNNAQQTADVIVLGGHLLGFASSTDSDYSTIVVPSNGQYTFETQGFRGACGFAQELNTILELYNSSGSLITSNDDINLGALNLCSRITTTLNAGRYYLRTRGYGSTPRRYFVRAR